MSATARLTDEEVLALNYDWEGTWARDSQKIPDGDWTTCLVLAGRGFGKALALDTPIPTPAGWTTMGGIRAGDTVFDERGRPTEVLAAYPVLFNRPCYSVRFDDGAEIVADAEHLWLTWDKAARKAHGRATNPRSGPRVVTTADISRTLMAGGRERNHSIDIAGPLQCAEADLPIDPYVFGLWLGDGDSAGATLTCGAQDAAEIFAEVRGRGEDVRLLRQSDLMTRRALIGRRPRVRDDLGRMAANGSLSSRLRALGVLKNKHVPAAYLRASTDQRRDLLAGLMDSDGYVSDGGHAEFVSMRKTLADAVFELAISLGHKATLGEGWATLNGRRCGRKHRVHFTPHGPVFKLRRKAELCHDGKAQRMRTRRRYIAAVDPVETRPVRCITVASRSRLYLAGRTMVPTHNTRIGAEWIRDGAETGCRRMALVGATDDEVRKTMVEGESGILACSRPDFYPRWETSKIQLRWPNGAIATGYSGANPEGLRGPNSDRAWCDELAAWKYPRKTWDNLLLGLRIGKNPRAVITTTPKPIRLLREIRDSKLTALLTGSTYENLPNLSDTFRRVILDKYEGTTLGEQELYAKLLDEAPGALWKRIKDIERHRVDKAPHFVKAAVAIDIATTDKETSDETGIVWGGLGENGHGYTCGDLTLKGSPDTWARAAVDCYLVNQLDAIVYEANQGGDLVAHTIRTIDPNVPVIPVWASRGKRTRAEPIAALAEQGRIHHVGVHAELEDELVNWVPGVGDSPNRLDAHVWLMTYLGPTPGVVGVMDFDAGFRQRETM